MSIENPFMNSNEERNPQENLSKFDRIKKIADDGGLPKKIVDPIKERQLSGIIEVPGKVIDYREKNLREKQRLEKEK